MDSEQWFKLSLEQNSCLGIIAEIHRHSRSVVDRWIKTLKEQSTIINYEETTIINLWCLKVTKYCRRWRFCIYSCTFWEMCCMQSGGWNEINSEPEPIQLCLGEANSSARSLKQTLAKTFQHNRPQEDTLSFQLFIFMLFISSGNYAVLPLSMLSLGLIHQSLR